MLFPMAVVLLFPLFTTVFPLAFGFSDEEILGAIAVMKADTVASGIYKEESDKEEK